MIKVLTAMALALSLVGCSTVAGAGKDITGAAEWTKEMMK
jgi:predicted small secreted protein